MKNSILLVVDCQKGFITPETQHIIEPILKLAEVFTGEVYVSKFVNSPDSPFNTLIGWHEMQKDTPGLELDPCIKEIATFEFWKETYSCAPLLLPWCQQEGVDTVYICGIDTDCCVLKTAVDLFESNIRPVVISNCCASTGGKESHKAGLRVLERLIGRKQIVPYQSILDEAMNDVLDNLSTLSGKMCDYCDQIIEERK